ncbi:hypothetical protein [Deinococcus hohokamensis]|uniref:Uncharacterized protein n=1 Tax=Deinococcus hohokamensis TaxID=309883 RepID=A0ABV9IEK7_9DEIO
MSLALSSPELAGHRARVRVLGQRVEQGLGQLISFTAVSLALLGAATLLGLIFMLGQVQAEDRLLLGVLALLAVGVLAVAWALNLVAMRAARRAVVSVTARAAGDAAPTLAQDTGRLGAWLTAWQWLSVASLVLGLVGAVPAALLDDSGSELSMPVLLGLAVLTTLLTSGPVTVLNWLILSAVKGFFTRVTCAGPGQSPVTPAAQRVGPWLEFTRVILWLNLGGLVLYLLVLLGIGAFSLSDGGADESFRYWALPLALLVLAFGVLVAWVYGLLIRLIGDSRHFALQAASTLDLESLGQAYSRPLNVASPQG